MIASNTTHQLPEELWTALLQAPSQRLQFQQGPFQVEVRVMPLRAKPGETAMLSPKDSKIPTPKPNPPGDLTELSLQPLPPPPSLVDLEEEDLSQSPAREKPEPSLAQAASEPNTSGKKPDLAEPIISFDLEPIAPASNATSSSLSAKATEVLSSLTPPPPSKKPEPTPIPALKTPVPTSMAPATPSVTPLTPPPASNPNTGFAAAGLGPSGDLQSSLSIGGGLRVGTPTPQARDLSTHASIQRVPTKMKTADWKKLIGEPVNPGDLLGEEPAVPEDATMLEVPSLSALKKRGEALKAQSSPSEALKLLDFDSDISVEEVKAVNHAHAKEPSSGMIPVIQGTPLEEDDSSKPENVVQQEDWSVELSLGELASKASSTSNRAEWQKKSSMVFRLLRTSDTIAALERLFKRMSTTVSTLNILFKDLPPHHPSPSEFAEASGVKKILKELVPFCYKGEKTPTYRVVGQGSDGSFVLLFQQPESKSLVFMPLDVEGQLPQIALVEGETLLNETELTALFQTGARSASPEEAKAKAQQVQQKLGTGTHEAYSTESAPARQANFEPPSTATVNTDHGLDKSIAVDQRLLNRFEFNRNHNSTLWDEDLQPGIAVFHNNSATLYIENRQVIEGVLLCILNQSQYLVFDRRSKRSVHLQPSANQRLWLRKDEGE